MKKVIVLVGESLSANGICAEAIMKELKSNGYKVTCITNKEYKTSNYEVRNGVKYIRIKPRLINRLNSWCDKHIGYRSWLVNKFSTVINKIKLIIFIPLWPLISPMYTYRFYKVLKKTYNEEKYNCVISIYTQIDTVIAGCLIKKKHPEVKFVPYFLDALSGGYGPKIFSNDWVIKRGLKWERKLLQNADKIIVMKSSQKHHEKYSKLEKYYSRITVLDIPLIIPKKQEIINTNILDKSKINLVYIGTIQYQIRNPRYILEIFKRINVNNCRLTLIGNNNCHEIIKRAQVESKNEIVVMKRISHTYAISVLSNADILVNIGNNISSMVPSKVFEYMSIGKPIISTYSINNEPSLTYLKRYPLSLTIKEDLEHINEAVLQVEKFIKNSNGKLVDFNVIKDEMYINTPQAFVDEIKLAIDH
ncbi:glycosyltransferase [Clostridium sp. HBUAS56017]|uniref:glycosyltransferase n=1 Tax=Clostridium sp. HBUAS56017 TaxID=2571128 RepID=UPI001177535C|nr:glycosyltransferase [Clostridium sp. HBUAS56017]